MEPFYHAVQLPLFPTKVCSRCNIEKFLSQFPKAPTCKDGHRSYCTTCHNSKPNRSKESQRAHYAANIEHKRQGQRDRYRKNIDQERQSRRKSYRKNIDRERQSLHKYYANNIEYFHAKDQKWRESNPTQKREKAMRRQARKRNATTDPVNYNRILERDGYVCHICGQAIDSADPKALHFDHVIPLSRGGAHSEENIKTSHSVCNLRKKDRLVSEMTPFQKRGPS